MDNQAIMEIGLIIIFLLTCFTGSLIQTVSGFGFGILVMTIFPYILPSYATSLVVSTLLSVFSTASIAWKMRKHIDFKKSFYMLGGFAVLNLFTIIFMKDKADGSLKAYLAVILIILSLYFNFLSHKIKLKPKSEMGIVFGGFSGFLDGIAGVGGPPAVLFLINSVSSSDVYLGSIQFYFFLTKFISLPIRAANGMFELKSVMYAIIGMPGIILGLYVGRKLYSKLKPTAIKKIIYVYMGISGVIMLVQSLI